MSSNIYNRNELKDYRVFQKPISYRTKRDDLRQLYKKLAPIQRCIFILYKSGTFTFRELSKLLNMPVDKVHKNYMEVKEGMR